MPKLGFEIFLRLRGRLLVVKITHDAPSQRLLGVERMERA